MPTVPRLTWGPVPTLSFVKGSLLCTLMIGGVGSNSVAAAQDRVPLLLPESPTLWVDRRTGDDQNDGRAESRAFASIQAAANAAQPGDIVGIKRGIYRESVHVPTSGVDGQPIVFRSYGRGDVVLSSGDRVTGWVHDHDDVWRAAVDWDSNARRENNTLFVNGELSYEARQFAENDLLDMDDWGQLPSTGLLLRRLRAPDLVGFGDDYWTGAKITFHVNDWTIVTRTVTGYDSGPGRVRFDPPVDGVLLKQTCGFYLHDTIKALDRPGEWFKDPSADVLYYHAEPGQNPNDLHIEFKRRGYAMDLRSRSHIHVENLIFRGATLQLDSGNHANIYEGNTFYAYGKGDGNGFDRMSLSGTDNIFRDNEVYETFHTAMDITGEGNAVVNNYFHDIAIQTGRMAINASPGRGVLMSHNTFRKIGRSVFDGYPVQSEVAYNLIEDAGRISWDTGAFDSDGANGNSSFSIFHHNVFRGTDARGILEGFYGQNGNAVIHHNLFHDWVSGYGRPTLSLHGLDFRQAYHNTVIGAIGPQGNTSARDAVQCRYNNNLQINTIGVAAIGVDMRGNHDYSPADFVDFGGRDFRLMAGSTAVDAGIPLSGINDGFSGDAPDAGALELGQAMWPVGHNFETPHRPTYDWEPLPGTNVFTNGYFSLGITDWTTVSGAPISRDFNSWNMGENSLTGTFRTKSVELQPGAEITRTFEGLRPNATYTVGCVARVVSEVTQGDQFDMASATVQTGEVRGVRYVTGIPDGGWVRYDNIDFGEADLYDVIELLPNTTASQQAVNGVRVQIRLDDPAGQVLLDDSDLTDEVDIVGRTWKRHVRSSFAPVTGRHSIYVIVSGANAPRMALGNIRLLDTTLDPADLLTASLTTPTKSQSQGIGAIDWYDVYETFVLTMGPSDTTASVSFSNRGRTAAYLDRMFLTEGVIEFENPNIAETDGFSSQSSTEAAYGPSLALDGDVTTFSRTDDVPGSLWQVSFYQPINPAKIELVNPANAAPGELGNFTVSVWANDPSAGGSPEWQRTYHGASGVAPGATFTVMADEVSVDGETRLCSVLGTVIRVQLDGPNSAGNGHLSLAEVRVLTGEDVRVPANVARGGIPEQSSDNSLQSSRGPHRAIDGYINPYDGFTSTLAQGNDWWQIDLQQTPQIDQIRLFNRGGAVGDRLRNFVVSVWDGNPNAGGALRWSKAYPGTAPLGGSVVFNGNVIGQAGNRLDSVTDGSFVRVRLNQANYLSFTEVQIWAR